MPKPRIAVEIISNKFPEIARRLPVATGEIVQRTLLAVETRSKILCPVDTGALRASIHSEMETQTSGMVSTNIEYSVWVEWGTTRNAAQPFMTPAGEAARGPFLDAMQELEALLD